MAEQLSNKGYMAMKPEAVKGTAVIPNTFLAMYDENFNTAVNLDEDNPIMGNLFSRFQTILGQRSHEGEATLLAEPNTVAHLFNMLLAKGTPTGAGPYTHPFTLSPTVAPNSYTIDIQKGSVVWRYIGAEISSIANDFDKNKMTVKAKFSALKSFIVREIASVSGAGPYTIVLKTNYDPSPTTGLVVGDTLRIVKAGGTIVDLTVATIVDGTSFTTVTNTTTAAGDLLHIRAATPTYALKTPFMWARTEFCFGADATAALSATQTRVNEGKWTIKNEFEEDTGSMKSGSFDPAVLVRTLGDIELSVKKFFDTPEDMNRFFTNQKQALVIRHYSETGYELRVTINNFRFQENQVALKTGEVVYAEGKILPVYDVADGQAFSVTVINNLATIA